jgi:hypothetical protein
LGLDRVEVIGEMGHKYRKRRLYEVARHHQSEECDALGIYRRTTIIKSTTPSILVPPFASVMVWTIPNELLFLHRST